MFWLFIKPFSCCNSKGILDTQLATSLKYEISFTLEYGIKKWDLVILRTLPTLLSKMPLELQPEDGIIRSWNTPLIWSFNYILYNTGCVRLKTCIHFINKQVKWTHYRPGVAQRVGRGIALLFHDRGTRRGWVVSSTPQLHFTPGKDPVPILQEAGWSPEPVWTGRKHRPTGIRSRTVQRVVSHYNDWATWPT